MCQTSGKTVSLVVHTLLCGSSAHFVLVPTYRKVYMDDLADVLGIQ